MTLFNPRDRQEFSNFHPHGEIEIDPVTPLVTSLPTANTFVSVIGWASSIISPQVRITADAVSGEIEVQERGFGVYQIQNNCSFFSSKANVICNAAIFLNGIREPRLSWTRSIQTTNVVANAGFAQVLQLNTGDIISFRMATDANGVDITLVDGALGVFWLSGE